MRKPKPFKIPRSMPRPLTLKETARKYNVPERTVRSIEAWLKRRRKVTVGP